MVTTTVSMLPVACAVMRSTARVSSAVAILALVATSLASNAASSHSLESANSGPHSSIPVQSGSGSDQTFCAQPPLKGTVNYEVLSGQASFGVAVRGLPHHALVGIDWANNTVRGYLVGNFRTDRHGTSMADTARIYRTGETRGYKLVLTSPTNTRAIGTLWPCGPPPLNPPAVAVDPNIAVSPRTGLADGATVKVAVSGFGVAGKVFLSECDSAQDANALGCGPQLAAQPFLLTGEHRSGSATFVVRVRAAALPYSSAPSVTCAEFCVIVATQGGSGAWAVAPIAFGSSRRPVRPRARRRSDVRSDVTGRGRRLPS
jgi:hypothetical protein